MRALGAGAQRPGLRRRRIVAAGGRDQDLLDQPGARAARARRLGVLAHVVERQQLALADRAHDRALADAVAAAHFGRVVERRGAVGARVPAVADRVLAEDQRLAQRADRRLVLDELAVPARVFGVADQAGTGQPVAVEHELLVDTARRVGERDLVGLAAALKRADRVDVDAGDLEPGRDDRALEAADPALGQVRRADPGLLEQRRDQAVGRAAVVDAFADRVDARVGDGLQRVGDDDAALAVQTGAFGERGVRADADRDDHQLGLDPGRLGVGVGRRLHPDRADAAAGVGDEFERLRLQQEPQPARFERLLQQRRRGLVELALHQPGHQVHDAHVHAAFAQPVGGLEPEQPAADDDRLALRRGRVDHRLRVGDVAVGQHAGQADARHCRQRRHRAGGEQQPVVRGFDAACGLDDARAAPDRRHRAPGVQADAVLVVPRTLVEHDLLEARLAGQHRREQDAVVVRVRLGAEDGDLVALRGDLQQLLDRAHAGHAVADHDQPRACLALHATSFSTGACLR